jgi:archaemetzincin
MSSEKPILVISPIGRLEVDRGFMEHLGNEIHSVFGYPTDIRPLLDETDLRVDPVRKQYHSTPILEKLTMIGPPDALKVLAITKVDLFIPILTHVYGEAQLGGKSCILSIYRFSKVRALAAGREIFQSRVAKEAVHELGHTFNLRHCRDSTCVMHYCGSVEEVDRKSNQFCRYCRVLLDDEIERLAI